MSRYDNIFLAEPDVREPNDATIAYAVTRMMERQEYIDKMEAFWGDQDFTDQDFEDFIYAHCWDDVWEYCHD